ncbi:Pathogenicity locus [Maioricimonas rarisocia]|uniref:Pathogenicity locus n=1 Tax=Maioricimonas rarisocia TaxID=2528026 RepID=A0A517Z9T4_9PLAN|nr:DUF4332 domain-containing protein [Maioricimonas rarisocia]QDU39247.1 Pathogenicity locus [Maioricimonas rarisocia]
MATITTIEGIGETYAEPLRAAGVRTTDALLKAGATRKGRRDLARQTGISEKLVLKWTNRADLFRVRGIGEEYADLLEASGVDTVPELAQRKPDNLHEKMADVNAKKQLVRRLPPLTAVTGWVAAAKKLDRVMQY